MSISKLNFNSESLIDLTDTSVTSLNLHSLATAHTSAGDTITGAAASSFPVEDALVDGSYSGHYENNRITILGYNSGLRYLTNLTSFSAANVTTLQGYDFDGCTSLTSVDLPALNSITTTGYNFRNTAISSFAWPSNVKTIPTYCFYGCANLSSFSASAVTSLGTYAFAYTGFVTATKSMFPSLVATGLGNYCFIHCDSLKEIDFPGCTLYSARHQFDYCTSLESVNLPDAVYGVAEGPFQGCSSLPVLVAPKITSANNALCRYCSKLRIIDLGPNITNITTYSFGSCTILTTIILRRTAAFTPLSNVSAFTGTPIASGKTGGTIFAPNALIDSYKTATNWSTYDGYNTITWTSIEGSPFEYYYGDGKPIGNNPLISNMLVDRTTSTETVTCVTDHINHAKITLSSATSPVVINLTTGEISSSTDIIDNKSTLFTIPAEVESKLWLYNIKNAAASNFAINFRLASAATSASFGTGNGEHTGALTITKTLDTAEDVSCLFMYINTPVDGTIEFDVAFAVESDRYI